MSGDGLRDETPQELRELRIRLRTLIEEATGEPMFPPAMDAVMALVQSHVDAAEARAGQALEALGRERNNWARQLADANDDRDTARAELEQVRSERSEDRQAIYRIEALIAEWEQLGRADGVHGRQLRRTLDGTP